MVPHELALDGQLQGHRQEPRPPWLLTKGSRLGQTSKLHIWGSPGPAQVDGSPEGLGSLGKVQCRQFLFRCSGRMSTRSSCGGDTRGAVCLGGLQSKAVSPRGPATLLAPRVAVRFNAASPGSPPE